MVGFEGSPFLTLLRIASWVFRKRFCFELRPSVFSVSLWFKFFGLRCLRSRLFSGFDDALEIPRIDFNELRLQPVPVFENALGSFAACRLDMLSQQSLHGIDILVQYESLEI